MTRDEIYDEVHEGLIWDQRVLYYRVEPGTPWDDDFDGVHRDEDGTIWVSPEAVTESMDDHLREAGIA